MLGLPDEGIGDCRTDLCHSWFVTELTSGTNQAPDFLTDSDNTSKSGVLYPLVNRAFILNGLWSALRFLASMKLPSRKGVHVKFGSGFQYLPSKPSMSRRL